MAIVVALSAATLSGSCTGFADKSEGPGAVLTAVLLAGGVALTISLAFLLLAPNLRRAKLLTATCVAAYLAAGFGAWFLFIWPLVVALVITVAGGRLTYAVTRMEPDSQAGSAAITTIAALAIGVSACIVVIAFWANYDLCIGFFGVSCSRSELNVVPFALTLGGVPPIAAVIAARLTERTGASGRALPEQYAPAFPGRSRPSVVELSFLIASVGLCAAIAMRLGLVPSSHRWIGYVDAPLSVLFAVVVALIVGVLFVAITPNRREAWFFAIVGVGAYVAGTLGTQLIVFGDPWQTAVSLVIVVISGGAAGYTARRKFDARAGSAVIAGVIALIGALAGAFLVAGAFGYVSVPFSHSPLFVGGVPPIVAAVSAFICGETCRQSR